MPRRNEDDPEALRLNKGMEAEDHFLQLLDHFGYTSEKSTDRDDEHQHWDHIVTLRNGTKVRVEVKGGAAMIINGAWSILIERFSKYGNKGWAYGTGQLAAIEKEDATFVIAKIPHLKTLLEKYWHSNVVPTHHDKTEAVNYVQYRRYPNLDGFIWVPLAEIEHRIWEFPELREKLTKKRANCGSKTFETQEDQMARIRRQCRL